MAHFSQIDDGAAGKPFKADAWKWQLPLSAVAAGLWFAIEQPIIAVALILSIAVHEAGHWLVAKMLGAETGGFFLVPLIGGCCRVRLGAIRQSNVFLVAAAGPLFGFLSSVPFAILGQTEATITVVGLNLFQLIPVVPLDGGRMLMAIGLSINRKVGAFLGAGAAASVGIMLVIQGEWGWAIACLFGVFGSVVIAFPDLAKNDTKTAQQPETVPPPNYGEWTRTITTSGIYIIRPHD